MAAPTCRGSMRRYARNVVSGSTTTAATFASVRIKSAVTSRARTAANQSVANTVNRYRGSGAASSR